MQIRYARLSTQGQELRLQYEALCRVSYQAELVWPYATLPVLTIWQYYRIKYCILSTSLTKASTGFHLIGGSGIFPGKPSL